MRSRQDRHVSTHSDGGYQGLGGVSTSIPNHATLFNHSMLSGKCIACIAKILSKSKPGFLVLIWLRHVPSSPGIHPLHRPWTHRLARLKEVNTKQRGKLMHRRKGQGGSLKDNILVLIRQIICFCYKSIVKTIFAYSPSANCHKFRPLATVIVFGLCLKDFSLFVLLCLCRPILSLGAQLLASRA